MDNIFLKLWLTLPVISRIRKVCLRSMVVRILLRDTSATRALLPQKGTSGSELGDDPCSELPNNQFGVRI